MGLCVSEMGLGVSGLAGWRGKKTLPLCMLPWADYILVEMIQHNVDNKEVFSTAFEGTILKYVRELKETSRIGYIGRSAHNPNVVRKAARIGAVDVLIFGINSIYDDMEVPEIETEDPIASKGMGVGILRAVERFPFDDLAFLDLEVHQETVLDAVMEYSWRSLPARTTD